MAIIKRELRKLLWQIPSERFGEIDKNVEEWMNCPALDNPRDFWNGFHGITMGFKLMIGLTYLLTAENIEWAKEDVKLNDVWFGTELPFTRPAGRGALNTVEVGEFFEKEENKEERRKWQDHFEKLRKETNFETEDRVVIVEKKKEEKRILSVYDGHNRLMIAVLEGREKIGCRLPF